MTTVIRSMDYGEGGPDYRIHFDVTYAGCPAKLYGPPEDCYPAEGAEWEITGIDCEEWDIAADKYRWVPLEHSHSSHAKHEIEAVYGWAESLDLSDECAEAIQDERDDAADARHEAARERQGE